MLILYFKINLSQKQNLITIKIFFIYNKSNDKTKN